MSDPMFRQQNRVTVCLPLRVALGKHPVRISEAVWQMNFQAEYTVTENISSGGCYFFLFQEPPIGTWLEMEITIPGEISDVPFARVYCQGKVIRVDAGLGDGIAGQPRFGVAATIERLQDVNVESVPPPSRAAAGEAIA